MQRATCTGLRIRSPADARIIFHAVQLNILPMVTRRLDNEERGMISPGCVYVWEERSPHADLTGIGIERWTDGIRWGPSRVREGFLFYHEKSDIHSHIYAGSSSNHDSSRSVLIKQTYTVYVDTPLGRRKWHLIAYFTEESIDRLRSVDDFPRLASITTPFGKYKSARSGKGRPEHISSDEPDIPQFPQLEYVPYTPTRTEVYTPVLSARQTTQYPITHIATPTSSPKVASASRSQSGSMSSDEGPGILAPLAYLENMAPPRRHPIDEKILKLLSPSRL